MLDAIFEKIYYHFINIVIATNSSWENGQSENWKNYIISDMKGLSPIILIPFFILATIAIIALVFGILNYRTNKKILKKLEEKKGDG